MAHFNDGHPPDHPADASDSSNVVPFGREVARRRPPAHFFTDSERSELRVMLAWYRDVRPKLEAIMQGCPTARREIAALLRGD